MFTLPLLTIAASAVLVQAGPLITAAPPADLSSASPTPVSAIDIGQCEINLQCCNSLVPVIDIPIGTLTLSVLPTGSPVTIPVLSLGPYLGFECSSATDLDIFGNRCLTGGTPVCCQAVFPGE
ncbi:hypothetical protein C8Q76DRAFT_609479 [Earliella scabrosa]|nr:hypothetical protein C8Q76DRAFT_609479 [Earliella scabrosa]